MYLYIPSYIYIHLTQHTATDSWLDVKASLGWFVIPVHTHIYTHTHTYTRTRTRTHAHPRAYAHV